MYDNITQTAIAVENPSQSAGNSDQTTPTKDNKKGNYDRAKSNLSYAIFINFYFYVHTLFFKLDNSDNFNTF